MTDEIIDIYKKLRKKKIFTYHIKDLVYECYSVPYVGHKVRGKKARLVYLEVKNYEKRGEKRLNPKYCIGEVRATSGDIRKMVAYFGAYLIKEKPDILTIIPYYDSPARRMLIFDRAFTQVGYNIIDIKINKNTAMNMKGSLYHPIEVSYSKNKEEFISRKPYEDWLSKTLRIERKR